MSAREHGATRDGARLTLILFAAMVALLNADQNLMAPNLTAIGADFGFDRAAIDQHLGADVNLAFWMLGGLVTLIVGVLTDRADGSSRLSRKRLLVGVAFLGQLACLGSGFARTYEQLFVLRALTGIGMGGSFPLVASLLGDMFPVERRAAAMAKVGLAIGFGITGGQMIAGGMGPSLGWHAPFLVIGTAGLLLNVLYLVLGKEPRRGQNEAALRDFIAGGHAYKERLRLRDLPGLFAVKTNLLILVQAVAGSVPWGMVFIYLNDFYAHDKGFSVPVATGLVMATGIGTMVGSFAGGLIGQRLFNRHPRYLPLFCAITTTAAVGPMALLISFPGRPGAAAGAIAIALVTGLLAGCVISNVNTMMINVNPPERRGAAFALLNLFNDLGRGLGAWMVGTMAASLGRVTAFHISNLLWVPCGLALFALARLLPREQAAVQARLQAVVARERGAVVDPAPAFRAS